MERIFKIFFVALIFFINVNYIVGCEIKKNIEPNKEWWQTAQLYQIYPRSFKDSDGDGIGDLNGITDKLDYFKEIGITAVWLSPIFQSPMADFGYDIKDFYDIHYEYGTMKDFENLIKKAKQIGLKIILDFVPNHSSNESEWFKKSIDRDPEYEDFYVWEDGVDDPQNPGKKLPPSNWRSSFRGSAWQWNEKRQQFYLHQFGVQQPDLNYRNPRVVERMKHVLRFWLNKGVDGFRIDAILNLFEVPRFPNGTYSNEPKSGLTDDPEDFDYLEHIYTQNQPETIDMVYQWRQLVDDYKRVHNTETKVMLLEIYSSPEITSKMYGNMSMEGAHLPFNFNFIFQLNSNLNAKDVKAATDNWLLNIPSKRTANWVIGNHDRRRIGTRYGLEKIDHMNMLVMILPGVSVTYQGEELGMLDGIISWEETVDPAGCNSNSSIYEKFSRDPCRTPFQWDDTKNAGFTTKEKPWLPMAPKYEELNVKMELAAKESHLKIYKSLMELRKTKTIKFGDYKYDAISDDVFVVLRTYKDFKILLVENFSNKEQEVDLVKRFGALPELNLKIKNLGSNKDLGANFNVEKLILNKFEALVFTTKSLE
ncbi:maltase A1-like [Condylostylus longicornis]|uniref:maltase A1-like n=1 Tax=Condylostylus longicornis TaxID=2530218 RepID=UPI00244E1CDF|nr:maltase A1-like [Condylostylus longicornis]